MSTLQLDIFMTGYILNEYITIDIFITGYILNEHITIGYTVFIM